MKSSAYLPLWITIPRRVALPVELQAFILHFVLLECSKPTWLACALTCHGWFAIVAPYLFNSITLKTLGEIEEVISLKEKYRSSHIWRYANHVKLIQGPGKPRNDYLVLIDTLSRNFPQVNGLCISAQEYTNSDDTMPSSSSRQISVVCKGCYKQFVRFRSLTTLSFQQHTFHSFVDLFRVCGSLHTLEELSMREVRWRHTPRVGPRTNNFRHRLRRVKASACTASWPLLWLWACYEDGGDLTLRSADVFSAGEILRQVISADDGEDVICQCSVNRLSQNGKTVFVRIFWYALTNILRMLVQLAVGNLLAIQYSFEFHGATTQTSLTTYPLRRVDIAIDGHARNWGTEWSTVDEVACRLPSVKYVNVHFGVNQAVLSAILPKTIHGGVEVRINLPHNSRPGPIHDDNLTPIC